MSTVATESTDGRDPGGAGEEGLTCDTKTQVGAAVLAEYPSVTIDRKPRHRMTA